MRTIIGILLAMIGLTSMIGGGLGFLIYGLYDIITNIQTIGGWRLVRDILFVCGGDVLAFIVGFVLFGFGTSLIK